VSNWDQPFHFNVSQLETKCITLIWDPPISLGRSLLVFSDLERLKKYTQNTEDVEDVGDEPAVSVTKITISSSLDFVAKNLLFCFYARFPFSKNHITILISFFLRNINFRLFIYFELIFAACFRSSKNQKFQIQIFKKL